MVQHFRQLTPLYCQTPKVLKNIVTEENKGSVDKWKDEFDKGAKYWGDKFKEDLLTLKKVGEICLINLKKS